MICSDMRTMRISIHALREESDSILENITAINPISIHALREESDLLNCIMFAVATFQSTLSVRRATSFSLLQATTDGDFNPRSP